MSELKNKVVRTVTYWYKVTVRRFKQQPVPFIFCSCLLIATTAALVMGYLTRGRSIENMLFFNRGDTFMDFFNSIQYGRKPYENGVIYPPLMNAIYSFFGHFIPESILVDQGTVFTREYQLGKVVFFTYMLVSLVLFVLIICKVYSKDKRESMAFALIVIFSLPFFFCIERGNSILLCTDFLLMFYYGYRSEDKLTRNLALICLAIATSMKIYVVCFGLLLLREKRYKDAIVCCIYGALVFFVPFLLFAEGNRSVFVLIHNILNASNEFSFDHYGYKLNISSITDIFVRITNLDFTVLNLPLMVLSLIPLAYGFFSKNFERWKVSCLLCMCMIMLPSFSYTYMLMFLIVPLLDFLDYSRKQKTLTVWDVLYLICFILLFIPFSLQDNGTLSIFESVHSRLTWTTILEYIVFYALWLILCIESVVRIMKNNGITKCILSIIPFVCVIALIGVQFCNLKEYEWPRESSVGMSIRENDELYTQISEQVFNAVGEKFTTQDTVFCFPTVPEFIADTEQEDPDKVEEINNIMANWKSPSDFESLLAEPEQIKALKPKYILINDKLVYENASYSELLGKIYDLGYLCDYKNLGVFSGEQSTNFQVWILNSENESTLFTYDGGTESKPYVIKSVVDFQEFGKKVNNGWNFIGRYIRLNNDIDLSNAEWTPIGIIEKGYAFSGHFNGNGYAVKNLKISKSQRLNNAALFGFMNGAVYNLDLVGGEVNGKNSASIVGCSTTDKAILVNCSASTTINGDDCGTFAYVFQGRIENCIFSGRLNGKKSESVISESSGAVLFNNYFVDNEFELENEDMSEHDQRIYKAKFYNERFGIAPYSEDEYNIKGYSNFFVNTSIIESQEFVETFNETLLSSSYAYMHLNKYQYDSRNALLGHTTEWEYVIPNDKIYFTQGSETDDIDPDVISSLVAYPNSIQYGPYYPLEKGTYVVTYEGEGLAQAKFDAYSNSDEKNFAVKKIQQKNELIEYQCTIDEDVQDIEFRLFNESADVILIDKVTLSHIG